MKLLLAEDTRDLNRSVTVLFQMQGYDVDSAFDGEQALEFLKNDSYDCVVLDIMMPKVDGYGVLSEMRRRHIVTPVLLLTAKAEIDDRVTGLDAGADDYLPKPFAAKELLARIRALTRRHRANPTRLLTFKVTPSKCILFLRLQRNDDSSTPDGAALFAKNRAPYSSQAMAMPIALRAIAMGE